MELVEVLCIEYSYRSVVRVPEDLSGLGVGVSNHVLADARKSVLNLLREEGSDEHKDDGRDGASLFGARMDA
jgi:hypothetical protein